MKTRTNQLLALLLALSMGAAACGSDATAEDATDDDTTTTAETAEEANDDEQAEEVDEESTGEAEESDDETSDEEDADNSTSGSSNTAEVVVAADAFLATLSDDEADTVLYDFGDSTITSGWSNLPACVEEADNAVERSGIQIGSLSDDQQTAFLSLAATALSDDGYSEFEAIRLADDYLQDSLGNTIWDSDCYSMAIYGTPSDTDAFAIQFGGHHVARMLTFEGDTVTVTPAFTGVEPGTFEVDGTSYDVMGDEMSAMYAIFNALDTDEQATAELSSAPDTVVMGPGTDTGFPDTEGQLVSELSDDQQALVVAAIETFVADFDSSVADTLLAEYVADFDETYVAWATGIDTETSGAYARIDGPSLWIEVSNEDGATGIHFHGIFRDKSDDYGDAA